ncbi:MAG: aspartyl protease family protein [Treponema sp.]|jgi:clan AA aspartic protease|nr:aspartyl protease family protein [Treponema sp.]
MGYFKEEITLSNAGDDVRVEAGLLKDIRTLTVEAMPDTGAWTLVVNEDIRQKLGLKIEETSKSTLANGETGTYGVTEGVRIRWKDRSTVLPALVVPEAQDVLLGALPLEAMDLIVDPVRKRLAGAHGDQPVHLLYRLANPRGVPNFPQISVKI